MFETIEEMGNRFALCISRYLGAALCLLATVILSSCGPSDLYRKLADVGRIQGDVDSSSLSLWQRSPTADSTNYALTAADDLDEVPRRSVTLDGLLDKSTTLESDDLIVLDSSLAAFSIPFNKWAGRKPFWDTDDFQMLMAYAHAKRAIDYAKKVFPTGNFSFTVYDSNNRLTIKQLAVFAAEAGDVFDTSYNPSQKSISFYRHDGLDEFSKFNPVLEADAIYHEVAHFIMHAVSCPVGRVCPTDTTNVVTMSIGSNTDLDALQEGLADFFAAVMVGDDRNFTFFNNNARELVSEQSRTGIDFFRSVGNDLYFPDGFRQAVHLDGRVLSGALNDFRKYLMGQKVRKVNCTVSGGETCYYTQRTPALTSTLANEYVLKLAFSAFSSLTRTSTLQDYALRLTELCVSGERCPDTGTAQGALTQILTQRGLLSSVALTVANPTVTFSQDQGVADFFVYPELGWRPFPDNATLADTDSHIEPCELIMVYPRVANVTQARATRKVFHSIKAQLISVDGFTEVKVAGNSVDPFPTTAFKPTKILGWLAPSEDFGLFEEDLSSRLYTVKGSSTFSKKFGKNFTVPSMGWIMFAPNELGKTGSLRLKYKTRVYNARTASEVESTDSYVSSLSVISSAAAAAENAAGRPVQNYTCGF